MDATFLKLFLGGPLASESPLPLGVPHGQSAGFGRHRLLEPADPLADCALGTDLDETGVPVIDELTVVPARSAGCPQRQVHRTQHREHGIGQIGGADAASQVLEHPSMVGQGPAPGG